MADKYKGYRMSKSVISYAVRRYYRYKLSLRDVSEMLLERGIEVSCETIRALFTLELFAVKEALFSRINGTLMK